MFSLAEHMQNSPYILCYLIVVFSCQNGSGNHLVLENYL